MDINRIDKDQMTKLVDRKLFVYTQSGVAVPNHRYVRPEIKYYTWDKQENAWLACYPVSEALCS